jgi:predicted GNAT family acetyltransferase
MPPDETHRARDWVHAAQAAVCDVIEPWEHGTIIRATRYPTYFDFNLVRVEDDADLTVDEVVSVVDEALAELPHRQVGFEVVEAGERVREGLEALGYQSQRLVWMRHRGGESVPYAIDVEEVPYDDVHELRVRWHYEDFPTLDTRDYFAHAREIAMGRDPRVFAVREGGTPIAYAEVERAGDAAEVASVYVHPDHRGAGLGTALTQAAIDSARDARDLWIVTDDDGTARPIYERLGFRSAWKILSFLRLPPE